MSSSAGDSTDLSGPLPPRPAFTQAYCVAGSMGLAWPPPPSPLTSPHPQLHQYQLSATLPRHPPAPFPAPLLELFRYLEFFVLLSGDCSHLSKLRLVSLKPPNPPSACKRHRPSSLPPDLMSLAHRAQSHWAPSHPSSCEGTPCPRACAAIPPAWDALHSLPHSSGNTLEVTSLSVQSSLPTNGALSDVFADPCLKRSHTVTPPHLSSVFPHCTCHDLIVCYDLHVMVTLFLSQ